MKADIIASNEIIHKRAMSLMESIKFLQYLDKNNLPHECIYCNQSDCHDVDDMGFIYCGELKRYTPPSHNGCGMFYPIYKIDFDLVEMNKEE